MPAAEAQGFCLQAQEVLHILQECWKEGNAAEEARLSGKPPELAQPDADYGVQRTQILGQLQQICSRTKGACTPQFVVEQVSRFPREMAIGGSSFQVQVTPLDPLKARASVAGGALVHSSMKDCTAQNSGPAI